MLFAHLGHSRVFALIHWAVPASSLVFFCHRATQWQSTGRWSESKLHPKQNEWWLVQVTVGTKEVNMCFEPEPIEDEMVSVHEGYGQNLRFDRAETKELRSSSWYL